LFKRKTLGATIAIAAVCGTAGVIAGIAGSAAAPSKSSSNPSTSAAPGPPPGPGHWRGRGLRHRLRGGPPVHADLVVPNSAGTGFDKVTMDNGKFKSVSGDQLTITEGTEKATYKDATLTIPSNATIRRNRTKANLSDLKQGDLVHVLVGPRGTFVVANDASHRFPGPPGGFRRFRGPGGPPGPGAPGPDGPPPPMP
jgi:hypothetical protein